MSGKKWLAGDRAPHNATTTTPSSSQGSGVNRLGLCNTHLGCVGWAGHWQTVRRAVGWRRQHSGRRALPGWWEGHTCSVSLDMPLSRLLMDYNCTNTAKRCQCWLEYLAYRTQFQLGTARIMLNCQLAPSDKLNGGTFRKMPSWWHCLQCASGSRWGAGAVGWGCCCSGRLVQQALRLTTCWGSYL